VSERTPEEGNRITRSGRRPVSRGKINIWGQPPGKDFNRSESNAGVARSGLHAGGNA